MASCRATQDGWLGLTILRGWGRKSMPESGPLTIPLGVEVVVRLDGGTGESPSRPSSFPIRLPLCVG